MATQRTQVLLPLLILLASVRIAAAVPTDSLDVRLETYRWEHRLLIVFAPADTSEALAKQRKAIEGHAQGFRDRDLLLFTIVGSDRGAQWTAPGADPQPLTSASTRRMRDRFDVPASAFRVVLVGKDGTEKRREVEPVPARSIFDTIDAMPMRQREMRENSGE